MFDKAIEKLRDEMARLNKPPISAIGEYLCDYITKHRDQAGLILQEKKTLEGAYKALEDAARKNRGGSTCVCIDPDEAWKIVRDYFGMQETKQAVGFDVDLDDLL